MQGDEDIYKGKPPVGTDDKTYLSRQRQHGPVSRTCESLRLNIKEANEGKTWLLLPDGFRKDGRSYPLPTSRAELQKIALIPLPENFRNDPSCVYIQRAMEAFNRKNSARLKLTLTAAKREEEIRQIKRDVQQHARDFRREAAAAVESVREEASKAIASLSDLFSLGRDGLGKIMQAHLDGSEWQGEKVSTDQFMGCFRMVSQAVKGLGLPSEERAKAHAAIMDEVDAALKNTRAAVAMATGDEGETEQ